MKIGLDRAVNSFIGFMADQVAQEWRAKYLTKWREARMFEAFILIEKRADQLLKILKG